MPPLPAERRAALAAAAGVDATNEAVAIAVERGRDGLAAGAIEAGGDPARVLVHIEHNLAARRSRSGHARRARRADRAGGGRHAHRRRRPSRSWPRWSPRAATAIRRRSRPPRASRPWTRDALEAAVDAAIAEQAGAWAKYCAGEDKAAGALVGAVMKATRGQADGKAVTALLQARRAGASAG